MDFFERMKETVNEFSKNSAEIAKESMEKISKKATEYSIITNLKMEIKSIVHKIDEAMTELGSELYQLHSNKALNKPAKDLKPQLEKIQTLKQELAEKEQQLETTNKEYASESIDKSKIKILKKELEEGGGTIEQIEIAENSPVLKKKLKSVKLPKEVLVGTILRNDQVIIPDGTYIFTKDDKVTLLGKKEDVEETLKIISPTEEK
jgi:hypothetical protein